MPTSSYDTTCITETNTSGSVTEICNDPLKLQTGYIELLILGLFAIWTVIKFFKP